MRTDFNKNTRGNVLLGLLLFALIATGSLYVFDLHSRSQKAMQVALRSDQLGNDLQSAIDTFIAIFRDSEAQYISHVTSEPTCATAKPLYLALKNGTACNASPFVAFSADRVAATGIALAPSSCTVLTDRSERTGDSVACFDPKAERAPILRLAGEQHQIGGRSFEFWLHAADPRQRELQFRVRAKKLGSEGAKETEDRIIHYTPLFSSLTHINHSGQVVRDRADPIHPCGQNEWSLLKQLTGGQCLDLGFLGINQALAYYKGRFFGLHADTGTILHLSPDPSADLRVDPLTGRVGGAQGEEVLFKYGISNGGSGLRLLQDADDFTITDREIYYIRSSENSSIRIRLISVRSNNTVAHPDLCDLTEMGWGQSYDGIVAAPGQSRLFRYDSTQGAWSDAATTPPVLLGLKNSNGAFLQVALRLIPANTPMTDRPPGSISTSRVNCFAFYAEEEQQIEFKRTFGFDRTGDDKPYYAF